MKAALVERFASLGDLWLIKLAAAILVTLFGPWREAYGGLLIVMVLDFLTGMATAAKEDRLSSKTASRKTLSKLLTYGILLIVIAQIEAAVNATPYKLGADFTVGAVLLFLISTEGLSVLENLEKLTGRRLRPFGVRGVLERLAGDDPP